MYTTYAPKKTDEGQPPEPTDEIALAQTRKTFVMPTELVSLLSPFSDQKRYLTGSVEISGRARRLSWVTATRDQTNRYVDIPETCSLEDCFHYRD